MAAVRLTDIYEPATFDGAVQESAIEYNRFIQSGVMVQDDRINGMVAVGGMVGEMPNFDPLTNDEPDYATDNPADVIVPDAISHGTQIFRLANQTKAWSTMDLARQLALQDPLGAIVNRVGHYWATAGQNRLLSTLTGVLADNIANYASDMVNTIAIGDGDNATAANLISAEAVIDTQATMGDHASSLTAIAMHSVVFANLKKQNLIDYIPDARGEVQIPTYLGLEVIEDDGMTVIAGGTSGFIYDTVLMGKGAFGYGTSPALMPSELQREALVGQGSGQDILVYRQNEIIHPQGFAFQSSGLAQGITATLAQLEAATQWDRVYTERKNIPLAVLKSNG